MEQATETLYVKLTENKYPVSKETLNQVFGAPLPGLQSITVLPSEPNGDTSAIVSFANPKCAEAAMSQRNGRCIYPDSNRMSIRYAQMDNNRSAGGASLLPPPQQAQGLMMMPSNVPQTMMAMNPMQMSMPPQGMQPQGMNLQGMGMVMQGGNGMMMQQQGNGMNDFRGRGRGIGGMDRGRGMGGGGMYGGMGMPNNYGAPQGMGNYNPMGGMNRGRGMGNYGANYGGNYGGPVSVSIGGPLSSMRGFGPMGGMMNYNSQQDRPGRHQVHYDPNTPCEFISITRVSEKIPLQRLYDLLECFGTVLWLRRNGKNKEIVMGRTQTPDDARTICLVFGNVKFYDQFLHCKTYPNFQQKSDISSTGDPNNNETGEYDFSNSPHRSLADRTPLTVGCTDTLLLTNVSLTEDQVKGFLTDRDYQPKAIAPALEVAQSIGSPAFYIQFADAPVAIRALAEYHGCFCGEMSSVLRFVPSLGGQQQAAAPVAAPTPGVE